MKTKACSSPTTRCIICPMVSGAERRRGERKDTRLWVRIVGLDDAPVLRRGDISVTGVFVEVDKSVGPPGTVKELHLGAADKQETFQVRCRVARVVMVQDLWRGDAVAGVAFEFAPPADAERQVHDVVRRLFPELETTPVDAPLVVDGVALHTRAQLAVGEVVRVEIELPALGQRVRVQGNVVRVQAHATSGYLVDVSTPRNPDDAASPSIGDALDVLLDGLLQPGTSADAHVEGEHLRGALSRIRLPSLLTWFDMERLSGVLNLSRGITRVELYIQQGRLIDAELGGVAAPVRSLLLELITWEEGDFDFRMGKVEREDKVGVAMSALLLDAVRQLDESSESDRKE